MAQHDASYDPKEHCHSYPRHPTSYTDIKVSAQKRAQSPVYGYRPYQSTNYVTTQSTTPAGGTNRHPARRTGSPPAPNSRSPIRSCSTRRSSIGARTCQYGAYLSPLASCQRPL
ncbi:hypothetical protein BJ165DRAFT_1469268 [Panaeolus papilionaceus]|nr:hypothetical protein BJ165DRAFT_1469268 [Panaeolus papilionaceus]